MKITSLILVLISSITIYINYNVNFSYQIQRLLLEDFNSGNYREITTAKFNALNTDIPSVTITSIPIKHFISRYHFLAGDYQKALSLIDEGFKDNPYLQLGNVLKAEYYEHLQVQDSMVYYANLAFENSPKNIRHFLAKMKVVSIDDDINELVKSYEIVKQDKNKNFPLVFMSTLLTFEKIPDSIKLYVDEITINFSNEIDVKTARDMIYYGKENIEKSIENSTDATQLFEEGKIDESLRKYLLASQFNPEEYTNFENIGLIYNLKKEYKKAIPFLKKVIDSQIRPIPPNGKSELILGESYLNLGVKDSACYYLDLSKNYNNKNAFKLHAQNCNN